MPNTSDMEHNIFFSHPHITVVKHKEKLKCIKKTLQPTKFRLFTVVNKEYINEELKHNFLRVWRYWQQSKVKGLHK
jgi:hypothetical protein